MMMIFLKTGLENIDKKAEYIYIKTIFNKLHLKELRNRKQLQRRKSIQTLNL